MLDLKNEPLHLAPLQRCCGERQIEPINRLNSRQGFSCLSCQAEQSVKPTLARPAGAVFSAKTAHKHRYTEHNQGEGTITQTRHSTALHHCKHVSNTRSHDSLQKMGGGGGGGHYSRLRLCVTNVMNGQKWTEDVKLDIYTVKDYSKAAQAIGCSAW